MTRRSIRLIRSAALVGAAALAAGGVVLATAGGASASAGCSVSYQVTSEWPGGFVASVAVTNQGDALSSWTLTWAFATGQQVSSAWNATVTQAGTQVTATGVAHNGALGLNAGTTFGFQGTWASANPVPSRFTLNGTTCAGGTGPSTVQPTLSISRPAPPSTWLPPSTPVAPTTSASASGAPSTPGGSASCPASGHVTYTLSRVSNPTQTQQTAYNLITAAMDKAVSYYNCYTSVTKALNVSYNPSVATADGNINGSIRFGATSTMQHITAMHEIGHTLGVGTYSGWQSKISNGLWTGSQAIAELRAITRDPAAVLHGDRQHFWPYGLNYTSEVKSDSDLVAHCRLVAAMRRDMGM